MVHIINLPSSRANETQGYSTRPLHVGSHIGCANRSARSPSAPQMVTYASPVASRELIEAHSLHWSRLYGQSHSAPD